MHLPQKNEVKSNSYEYELFIADITDPAIVFSSKKDIATFSVLEGQADRKITYKFRIAKKRDDYCLVYAKYVKQFNKQRVDKNYTNYKIIDLDEIIRKSNITDNL